MWKSVLMKPFFGSAVYIGLSCCDVGTNGGIMFDTCQVFLYLWERKKATDKYMVVNCSINVRLDIWFLSIWDSSCILIFGYKISDIESFRIMAKTVLDASDEKSNSICECFINIKSKHKKTKKNYKTKAPTSSFEIFRRRTMLLL